MEITIIKALRFVRQLNNVITELRNENTNKVPIRCNQTDKEVAEDIENGFRQYMNTVDEIFKIFDMIKTFRASIDDANHAFGMSELLGDIKSTKDKVAFLKWSFMHTNKANDSIQDIFQSTIDDIALNTNQEQSLYHKRSPFVLVEIVPGDKQKQQMERVKQMQLKISSLMDRIEELNHTQTIKISDEHSELLKKYNLMQ